MSGLSAASGWQVRHDRPDPRRRHAQRDDPGRPSGRCPFVGDRRSQSFRDGVVGLAGQEVVDLLVGQARLGTHRSRIEAGSRDLARLVDRHVADQAQAVFIGLERAQAIGQRFRQHRDDATGKIHRGGPVFGFPVQGRSGFHIMRNIGDRNHQAPAVLAPLGINGVIEIPGIRAVDGDQRQIAQIAAALHHVLGHHIAESCSFLLHAFRPFVWQVEIADGDLGRQARSPAFTQDFDDFAERRLTLPGLLQDFRHHDLSGPCAPRVLQRHQDILVDARVVRHYQRHPALFNEAADHYLDIAPRHIRLFGEDGASGT